MELQYFSFGSHLLLAYKTRTDIYIRLCAAASAVPVCQFCACFPESSGLWSASRGSLGLSARAPRLALPRLPPPCAGLPVRRGAEVTGGRPGRSAGLWGVRAPHHRRVRCPAEGCSCAAFIGVARVPRRSPTVSVFKPCPPDAAFCYRLSRTDVNPHIFFSFIL